MLTPIYFGTYPILPDDLKSRFTGELMESRTTVSGTVVPLAAKRRRNGEHGNSQPTRNDKSATLPALNESMCVDPLESISMEAFWERMAFRQECSSGEVEASFVVYVYTSPISQLTAL